MDSIRFKTKQLQSKMYLTQTQTHRLRLIDNLVPRASVAFPQKASRPADISCDAVHLEQEHKWPKEPG